MRMSDWSSDVFSSDLVPVIAVGRVLPELAEEMVAAGDCDFVALGRPLLTDPALVSTLRGGRRSSIRPCITCYVCVAQNLDRTSTRLHSSHYCACRITPSS